FYDAQGNWVPTPLELQQQVVERARQETETERVKAELAQQEAEAERARAELAQQEAEAERLEKEKALEKAARLAAQLKALGIDPDQE
ncbi:MAG TPA: Uma2 family endonuclease, partial [Acidobacteriota bacterium]|nr:Uma2 family endonuclease [Acidobacteriota bacterium]